ncbi:hypothetical protein [Neobacillus sp. D3-1R]|uniref:hypothetical protein n=1 Tax=Neobacillus sp. D3-1R TaxID=3445778 RepID=UPI003F9EC1E3
MKKTIFSSVAAGALALGIMASSAFASVTIDGDTGTGFVGKGDVQTALGLNNAQMQNQAESLKFTYETVETYEVTVQFITGEGTKGEKTHIVEHKRSSSVNSDVLYDARKAKQYTGFNLNGFTNTTSEGVIPAIGDEFPGESDHTVTSVELVSSQSTLYVNDVALQ